MKFKSKLLQYDDHNIGNSHDHFNFINFIKDAKRFILNSILVMLESLLIAIGFCVGFILAVALIWGFVVVMTSGGMHYPLDSVKRNGVEETGVITSVEINDEWGILDNIIIRENYKIGVNIDGEDCVRYVDMNYIGYKPDVGDVITGHIIETKCRLYGEWKEWSPFKCDNHYGDGYAWRGIVIE